MPIIQSAKKALRQNVRHRKLNLKRKAELKETTKAFQKLIQEKKIKEAREVLKKIYKTADKTAKTGYIKKNKAARIRSRASKLLAKISS